MSRSRKSYMYHDLYKNPEDYIIRPDLNDQLIEDELRQSVVVSQTNEKVEILPFMRPSLCHSFTPRLNTNLLLNKLQKPTPIQSLAIPYLLENQNDILISSRPGTGKTLTYLLPLLDMIYRLKKADECRPGNFNMALSPMPYGLIILPTNFLIKEIASLAHRLSGGRDIKMGIGLKNENPVEQRELKKIGCDLYIGILGKVKQAFMSENEVNCPLLLADKLRMVVLDDLPCDCFRAVGDLLKSSIFPRAPQCRTIVVTSDKHLEHLDEVLSNKPIEVSINNLWALKNIKHEFYDFKHDDKLPFITNYLKTQRKDDFLEKTLIFVKSHETARSLLHALLFKFKIEKEDDDVFQIFEVEKTIEFKDKSIILDNFREGVTRTLIVVEDDKIIRGLNLPNVKTVILFDFPCSGDDYVRKVGRCGRSFREGRAITLFVASNDLNIGTMRELKMICEQSQQPRAIDPLKAYL